MNDFLSRDIDIDLPPESSMMRRLVQRLLPSSWGRLDATPQTLATRLPYSWILTNQLAIGPMPASSWQWQQLEEAGFRCRFNCCYPQEGRQAPIPLGWRSAGVPLPDHRQQEELRADRLVEALNLAESLLVEDAPVYLHCLAGIERSPLIAVGLTARLRQIDIFDALDWVRRCHPPALPIYSQLDLLDQVLKV